VIRLVTSQLVLSRPSSIFLSLHIYTNTYSHIHTHTYTHTHTHIHTERPESSTNFGDWDSNNEEHRMETHFTDNRQLALNDWGAQGGHSQAHYNQAAMHIDAKYINAISLTNMLKGSLQY